MRSPRTPRWSLRKRGKRRFRPGMALENSGFMRLAPASFGSEDGFLEKHHRDVVPDRIDARAGITLQARFVWQQTHRLLAKGTGKNGQKLLGNRHGTLQSTKGDCNRLGLIQA